MMKIIKGAAFLVVLSGLFVAGARAQGSYKAASCNEADVNAVINGPTHTAVSGDTINIPAGSCTWTSELSVPVGITLIGTGTQNSTPGTFGAGTLTTTIIDNAPSSGPMIDATVPYGQTLRISTLLIEPNSSSTTLVSPIYVVGSCTSGGCPNLRADNLEFTGWSESGNGTASAWMLRVDGVYGVVDHNTIPSSMVDSGDFLANVHYSSWLGVGEYGDNSWVQPDSFGTASQLYFENNSLAVDTNDCDETPGTTGGGCRITVRFNQFPGLDGGQIMYFHGTETTDRTRGGRQAEIYGNTVNCTSTTRGCYTGADARSGVILNFGNTYTIASGSWYNSYLELDAYRIFAGFPPWGYCAGQGPYDNNDGTVYASGTITAVSTSSGTLTVTDSTKNWSANAWINSGAPYSIVDLSNSSAAVSGTSPGYEITASTGNTVSASGYSQDYWNGPPTFNVGDKYEILRATTCIDQPSRSGGTYISGSTPSPTGGVSQSLDPSYEWDDSGATPGHGNVTSDSAKMIANRDWYTDNSNGTPHAQTSPTSPFNGTSGVGFGTLANRPTTCTTSVGYWATDQGSWNQSGTGFGQGEFFVCTSANTWTLDYTPYTYPHPLTQNQSTSAVPAAPANLQAVGN